MNGTSKWNSIPTRCAVCQIGIFPNAAAAAAVGSVYAETINQAVGDLCVGCAGGDAVGAAGVGALLASLDDPDDEGDNDMPRQKKNESNGKLFVKCDIGVKAPPDWRRGKYHEMDEKVMALKMNGDGKSQWARFLFAKKKDAKNAASHATKLHNDEFKTEKRIVPAYGDDAELGEAWLYVRRVAVEAEK